MSKFSMPVHEPLGLRIDLMHRDSTLSAVFPGNITSTKRFARAVQRSRERLERCQMSVVPKAYRSAEKLKQIGESVTRGQGEFMMTIAIGSPSLSFSAILDTGSDLIWTQCQPCNDCYGQSTPIYDPSLSSSYNMIKCKSSECYALDSYSCAGAMCQYTYTYSDASSTMGMLSSESFTLSSGSIHHFVFGCGQDNQGNFGGGDGIVGFGRGPLSLISQLIPLGANKFSYCLVSATDSPSRFSPLFIGHTASLNPTTVRSTPFITSALSPTFYYLSLEGISVGGQLLNIPAATFDLQSDGSGGVIIDPGTAVTFLQSDAYDVLKEALNSSINLPQSYANDVGLDLCYRPQQSDSSSADFPTITFHFKGADYDLPKENYIYSDDMSGVICLAMLPSSYTSIFGNYQQQNYQILYDNGNNVLSFASTVCDTL